MLRAGCVSCAPFTGRPFVHAVISVRNVGECMCVWRLFNLLWFFQLTYEFQNWMFFSPILSNLFATSRSRDHPFSFQTRCGFTYFGCSKLCAAVLRTCNRCRSSVTNSNGVDLLTAHPARVSRIRAMAHTMTAAPHKSDILVCQKARRRQKNANNNWSVTRRCFFSNLTFGSCAFASIRTHSRQY